MLNNRNFPGLITANGLDSFWINLFIYKRILETKTIKSSVVHLYKNDDQRISVHFTQKTSDEEEEFYKYSIANAYIPCEQNTDFEVENIISSVIKKFNLENKEIIRYGRIFEVKDELLCVCEFGFNNDDRVNSVFIRVLSGLIDKPNYLDDLEVDGYTKDESVCKDDVVKASIAYISSNGWETNYIQLRSSNIHTYLEDNYNNKIVSGTHKLVEMIENKQFYGRSILIYGDPGTGKSFWIRGLAKHFSKQYNIVIIPSWNDFFSNMNGYYYLSSNRPSMFIFEDSGKMFTTDAKNSIYEPILLNLTDGLITSGKEDIFVFSFNQKIDNINEALVRPGRCLSVMDFDKLNVDKSNAFLEKHRCEDIVDEPKTLGELYAIAYKLSDKVVEDKKTALGFVK